MGSGRGRKRRAATTSPPGDDEFARQERMFGYRLRERCPRFPGHFGPQLLEAKVMRLVEGEEEQEWQVSIFLSRGRDKISVVDACGPNSEGDLVATGNGRERGFGAKELERVISTAQSMIEERRITRWQSENDAEISVATLEKALKARGVIGDASVLASVVNPQKQVF